MSAAPRVLIVADDLSGAADSAATLAARAPAAVALQPEAAWPGAEVVAVDTDSRYLPASRAAAVCAAAASRAAPHTLVYKKIDSTLRGNIGPETAAVLKALVAGEAAASAPAAGEGAAGPAPAEAAPSEAAPAGADAAGPNLPGGEREPAPLRFLAVVASAFPATGRTVLGGQVHVGGAPLVGTHPERPPVAEQLQAAGLDVAALPLRELRGHRVQTRLREMAGAVDAVVVDALTDDDLARTVRACRGLRVLFVGSGGLAHHLPLPEGAPPSAAKGARAADPAPALFCLGSRSRAALDQRRVLLDEAAARAVPVPQDPEAVPAAARRVAETLADGQNAAVFPDPGEPVEPRRAGAVAAALAEAAGAGAAAAGTLVATGGETARAVLCAAGVETLHVLGETEPGVVRMSTPDGLRVITKAGSFGDAGTLLRTARSLHEPGAAPRERAT